MGAHRAAGGRVARRRDGGRRGRVAPLTFGEYRDQVERVAAGLAAHGHRRGRRRVLAAAHLVRVAPCWWPRCPASGRSRTRSCPSTAAARSASSPARPAAKLLIVPADVRWLRLRGHGHRDRTPTATASRSWSSTDRATTTCPKVTRPTCRRRAEPPDDPADLPVRWLFYTSGTTADPKGAKHTDASVAAIAKGMGERYRATPEDRGAMVFPFTHIGGITWLFTSLQFGSREPVRRGLQPGRPPCRSWPRTASPWPAPARRSTWSTWRPSASSPTRRCSPTCGRFPGGGAPKPPQLHYDLMAEMGGVGILSGYGLTEAPILTLVDVRRQRRGQGQHRGPRHARGRPALVSMADGSICGPGEEGEIRAKAPQLMRGLPRRLARRRRLRRRRLLPHRRPGCPGRGRQPDHHRSGQGHHHPQHGEHLGQGGRGPPLHPRPGRRRGRHRPAERAHRRDGVRRRGHGRGRRPHHLRRDGRPPRARQGLRKQALPERLEIVDAVPRNPTGKIVKYELVERFS